MARGSSPRPADLSSVLFQHMQVRDPPTLPVPCLGSMAYLWITLKI
jgi:hypothetical protein